MAPNEPEPSKMYIILDIRCNSHLDIDNSKIPYEVFRVKKKADLYVALSLAEARSK